MKQMELARRYFEEFGRPMIESQFPQLKDSYAAGLAGEGSGCLGYDDEISQDHDFALGFCIWLKKDDFDRWGSTLQQAYDRLPSSFMGFDRNNVIDAGRLGVIEIGRFYRMFTGCPEGPSSNMDWFLISEPALAAAASGEVFVDRSGEFSAIRRRLQRFYPRDILLKKLAARAAVMAQSGQYNLPRCLKRGDTVAASLAMARFAETAISALYLLVGKPMPFYKWSYRGLSDLSQAAFWQNGGTHADPSMSGPSQASIAKAATFIKELFSAPVCDNSCAIAEEICILILDMMADMGLIRRDAGDFAQDYTGQLMEQIIDPQIRSMHPMADCPV